MSGHECQGCSEYHLLSRRQFMAATGGTALAAGLTASLPRIALADDDCSGRDVVVTVYLRGAADGLTMCVPHADDAYYTARPTLAVPRPDSSDPNRCTNLDGFFGLPGAMLPLLPAYQAGHLLFVHACGSPDPSRSHFDAQRYMEVGKPADIAIFDGWLSRHLISSPPFNANAILRGVSVGHRMIQSLQGAPKAIPIPDMGNYGLAGWTGSTAERRAVISDLYAAYSDPLRSAAASTQATIDLLAQVDAAHYTPAGGADYSHPVQGFSYALKTTAALIKAEVGVEAVAIDIEGWDTHGNQQPFAGGYMYSLMETLAKGLAAFHADVIAGSTKNVTVVVMTEFGRRVEENNTGTDHGHGGTMLLMGRGIAGGRVLRQWPGLAVEQRFQGLDLAVTIDWRDILAEVVDKRLANAANLGLIFPGYTPTYRGVTRACGGGDTNCDGQVNLADVAAFNQALVDPAGYQAAHPGCSLNSADVNADGAVDGRDVAAFTKKLTGP